MARHHQLFKLGQVRIVPPRLTLLFISTVNKCRWMGGFDGRERFKDPVAVASAARHNPRVAGF